MSYHSVRSSDCSYSQMVNIYLGDNIMTEDDKAKISEALKNEEFLQYCEEQLFKISMATDGQIQTMLNVFNAGRNMFPDNGNYGI